MLEFNDEVEELIESIKEDGENIRNDAYSGCEIALRLITYSNMWINCPNDGMSYMLTDIYYKKWKAKEGD